MVARAVFPRFPFLLRPLSQDPSVKLNCAPNTTTFLSLSYSFFAVTPISVAVDVAAETARERNKRVSWGRGRLDKSAF